MPLLFAGQAQKEFYVNSALNSLDVLVHTSVSGTSNTPPTDPNEGETWLVTSNAQGDWAGHVDKIAIYSSGGWSFIAPSQGMRLFDNSQGRFMHFDTSWFSASSVSSPEGGAVIDAEARASIDGLIAALQEAGIFART